MSKIAAVKRIIVEDFGSEYRELVTRLSSVLNPFLDQAVTALQGRLTYTDNMKGKTYKFTLAAGVSSIVVAWDYNEQPTAVMIANLSKQGGAAPTQAFSLSSYPGDKKITLSFIGLDAAADHYITVRAQI